MTAFFKKWWWAIVLVVILWLWRVQLGSWVYKLSGGKISLFGVKGGAV